MRVRGATPGDWTQVAILTVAAYTDGGFVSVSDRYIDSLADVETRAEASTLLVVDECRNPGAPGAPDGKPIAAVAVAEAGSAMAEVARPGEVEFRMLAVDPAHQGRGIARMLVRHILDSAQRRPDITGVTLCSMNEMTAAHALYRSEGFVTDPERDLVLTDEADGVSARFPFFIRHL